MSAVTTHVLDTARGVPAAGIQVWLEQVSGAGRREIARTRTGYDGRAAGLGPQRLPPGTYRLVFDTAEYFASVAAGGKGAGRDSADGQGAAGKDAAAAGTGGEGAGGEGAAGEGAGGEGAGGEGGDNDRGAFFPEVAITFTADTADGEAAHYHVPLLLSPFGYATYRGS
ncbi:MAG TPA: hydroxyisourate hydrolase [Streptosporangiaceae bacterium]|nr:hydroxyisourate hydrolase [Streptosporangiaceae bacterium]